MRRKRFRGIFGEPEHRLIDWPGNSIDRIFSPHLSKSAPCQCCPSSSQCGSICVRCFPTCNSGTGAVLIGGIPIAVKVSGGATVSTGTSSSSGYVCLPIYAAGNYDVVATPTGSSDYLTATNSLTSVPCSGSSTTNTTILLPHNTTNAVTDCCSNTYYCRHPINKTLSCSGVSGVSSLIYTGSASWSGCTTTTSLGYTTNFSCAPGATGSISVPVTVTFQCVGSTYDMTILVPWCSFADNFYKSGYSCAFPGSTGQGVTSVTKNSCSPLSVTFTFTITSSDLLYNLYGATTLTVTVSE